MEKTILIFETREGKCPFSEWLLNLKDSKGRAVIRARLERVRLGNLGDCKNIGDGVNELARIDNAGRGAAIGDQDDVRRRDLKSHLNPAPTPSQHPGWPTHRPARCPGLRHAP